MTLETEDLHFFSRGGDSLVIDLNMHKDNRNKFHARVLESSPTADAIIFEGGSEIPVYNTDTVWDFKQESNFQYLFGVKEPGCVGVIILESAESILFIPRLPKEYAQWMGPIKSTQWFRESYLVDNVFFVDELPKVLSDRSVLSLGWYDFCNLDSGLRLPKPTFPGSENFKYLDGPVIAHALNECRLVKSSDEIRILQYTNDVSSRAHIATMIELGRQGLPKIMEMEHFAETNFRYEAGLGGCARVGYHCIACSGMNNAVLHYGHAAEPNNGHVQAGSLRLLDMGAEYHGYTADVTVTFPTGGKFSNEQRIVYDAVWCAVLSVERSIKPGVDYRDMHRLSQRVILEYLLEKTSIFAVGLDDLMKYNIASYFYPHGLGHNLGLDVHDVGGYHPGVAKDKSDMSIKGLRLARELQEGMVITVEPGFYFIDYLLDELRSDTVRSLMLNWAEVEKFRVVGGIRIEDNIVVTNSGCRVLTDVPRTVDEIEAVMSGKIEWVVGKQYRVY